MNCLPGRQRHKVDSHSQPQPNPSNQPIPLGHQSRPPLLWTAPVGCHQQQCPAKTALLHATTEHPHPHPDSAPGSLTCDYGQLSLAAISSSAPSMTAASSNHRHPLPGGSNNRASTLLQYPCPPVVVDSSHLQQSAAALRP
jgi:hypothetical protein